MMTTFYKGHRLLGAIRKNGPSFLTKTAKRWIRLNHSPVPLAFMTTYTIRLNKQNYAPQAVKHVARAMAECFSLSGGGAYTARCQKWLESKTGTAKALLTSSCTDALEMAALLADLKAGDEVIMPSFTFSSTATAIVLRGAVPVFIDIRSDTLNMDEALIEAALTPRTRAICPVHYAGVGCDMDQINRLARKHKLLVIEDAAQAVGASYKGKALGALGDFGAFSFHDSKVISSGEGGALLVHAKKHARRAEILWEKGTNRSQLIRGEVKKYTWVDVGSSFLMSEVSAALLETQLKISAKLIRERLKRWRIYHQALASLEEEGLLRRPIVPPECTHNGHIYYILLSSMRERDALREHLGKEGIEACFHYVPLHSAPAGRRYGRVSGEMSVTDKASATLLRLPIFADLAEREQKRIIRLVHSFWNKKA